MKRLALSISALLLLGSGTALAQDNENVNLRRDGQPGSVSTTAITPEMWLYEQERDRYLDPQAAVRRRAEIRGAQRQQRIASMKWYGYSNQRPVFSPTPWHGPQSPGWSSNSSHPFRWRGTLAPRIVLNLHGRRLH